MKPLFLNTDGSIGVAYGCPEEDMTATLGGASPCGWARGGVVGEMREAMHTGKVVRFDEVRGYGFIAPDDGGDDVFVHANTLDGDKWTLMPGVPVEFEAVESDRGPKALVVRVIRTGASTGYRRATTGTAAAVDGSGAADRTQGRASDVAGGDDEEGLCDVLSERTFLTETTEALLSSVPDLTAAQVVEVRRQMLAVARRHGWVEG